MQEVRSAEIAEPFGVVAIERGGAFEMLERFFGASERRERHAERRLGLCGARQELRRALERAERGLRSALDQEQLPAFELRGAVVAVELERGVELLEQRRDAPIVRRRRVVEGQVCFRDRDAHQPDLGRRLLGREPFGFLVVQARFLVLAVVERGVAPRELVVRGLTRALREAVRARGRGGRWR